MSEEELIETLRAFEKNRVEQLEEPARNLFFAIMKIADERDRLNNIIKHTDSWIDRTIEIIKQQPSEDDTWILERLNGIKQCLKGADKE